LEERYLKKKILVLLVSMALIVGILSGCTEEETEDEEPTNTAPEAAFTPSATTAAIGEDITFTDGSTDADEDDTLTYSWDFGDDVGTSTEQSPMYNYSANGSYTVTLTVSDGTDTATATATIIIGNVAPVADFTSEAVNLTVTFTDASTDANADDTLTYAWDFNDGEGTNTTAGPVTFTFAAYDTAYNVTLTVTDDLGESHSVTKVITLTEATEET
jgi:PKD repeat protein